MRTLLLAIVVVGVQPFSPFAARARKLRSLDAKTVARAQESQTSGRDFDEYFWGWDVESVNAINDASSVPQERDFDRWFWSNGSGGITSAVFTNDERSVILFDGICNFCSASVNWIMDHDPSEKGTYRFAAQQSSIGQSLLSQESGKTAEDLNSIVLITKDGLFCKSDAVLLIAKGLKEPYSTLSNFGALVPRPLRNAVYEFVSANRGVFGTTDSCRILDENEVERFLTD